TGEKPLLNAESWVTETLYDALSRPLQHASIGIGTINYEYGGHLRLERARLRFDQDQDTVVLEEARYDSAGRLSILRFGNGAWVRRHYNASGRLAHLGAAVRGNDTPLQDLSV